MLSDICNFGGTCLEFRLHSTTLRWKSSSMEGWRPLQAPLVAADGVYFPSTMDLYCGTWCWFYHHTWIYIYPNSQAMHSLLLPTWVARVWGNRTVMKWGSMYMLLYLYICLSYGLQYSLSLWTYIYLSVPFYTSRFTIPKWTKEGILLYMWAEACLYLLYCLLFLLSVFILIWFVSFFSWLVLILVESFHAQRRIEMKLKMYPKQ